MAQSNKIIIFDTTLRDGEQSPGATMLLKEKLAIAQLLDTMGVDVIEAGFAAASKGDAECIQAVSKAVKNASVCSLARAVPADIETAAKALEFAKKPRIHTFMSTSDIHIEHQFRMTYDQVLDIIGKTVTLAKSLCDDVEWSAMDATRSNIEFLTKAVGIAVHAGARTVNIPDTVGYTQPDEFRQMIATLAKAYPETIFSVHCHNDLGLATANSLAGILGGARQVECTINGIGERAENAAMEEVVMALKTRQDVFGCDTSIDTQKIYPISRFVSSVTGFAVQKNKAIVGANAFAHESGIHQDGMLKNRNTYEIISPETVGMTSSQIVLGKHSGRAALKSKIAEWGLDFNDAELQTLMVDFKALCDRKKHVTEEDILALAYSQKSTGQGQMIDLVNLNTTQHSAGIYSAEITIQTGPKESVYSAQGDGPLDAIFSAINMAIPGVPPHLQNFEVHSISHGTDAQAEANISLKYAETLYAGHARNTDTIRAAALAYVSAVNKILAQTVNHTEYQGEAA